MRVLRAGEYLRMPWKNGGGETAEIAAFPPGATVDDFDWRVSMATVASDGPFSSFPGVDRTLTVLEGEGLALAVDEQGPVTLTPLSPPLAFPADVSASATLVGGPVTDFNVMTRRGRFSRQVRRFEVDGTLQLDMTHGVVFALAGQLSLWKGGDLGLHDSVLVDDSDSFIRVEGRGRVLAVWLDQEGD